MKKFFEGLVVLAILGAISLVTIDPHMTIAQNIGGGGTVNGNTITTGTGTLTLNNGSVLIGTGSQLSVVAGKTAVIASGLTFSGTDSTIMTFPTTSATIARTDAVNSFTGTIAADQASAGKVGEYQEVQCLTATSGASQSFTNATPTVGTWASPPWTGINVAFNSFACPFQITANAPTGLSTATNYWAVPIDATTFHVATSAANAAANTFAATSGAVANANLTSNIALTSTAGLASAVLNLTAGDWDCMGSTIRTLDVNTSVTNMQTGISSSSTGLGVLGTYGDLELAANVMTNTNNPVRLTPMVRLNLNATTAEYLVALDTFTVGANKVSGDLRCRRIR
jgi:hypothetical protein